MNATIRIKAKVQFEHCLTSLQKFNQYVTNGLSHPYHLDESIFIFKGIGNNFLFFNENYVSKQNSPKWVAALCGVTSGAILFAYVP